MASEELRYNQRQGFTISEIKQIECVLGVAPVTGRWSQALVDLVWEWQRKMGIEPDGRIWCSVKGNTWPLVVRAFEGDFPKRLSEESPDIDDPESPVAPALVKSLGTRQKKYGIRRSYSAIIVHTTGLGPVRRWKKERDTRHALPTPFETAVERTYHVIMDCGPHYVVGQEGECAQVCPEVLCAWHVGGKNSRAYREADWKEPAYEWWAERWSELESPLELASGMLWHGGGCNPNVIGIEVVPPLENPTAAWSDACRQTLVRLLDDICERRSIPRDREHILTHSDAHPIARTTRSGEPWDPGEAQWPSWDALFG